MLKAKSPSRAKKQGNRRGVAAPEPVIPAAPAAVATLRIASKPVFAEPQPMPDPSDYREPHASDSTAYGELDQLKKQHQFNPLPFRVAQGVAEPVMTLAQAYGSAGTKVEQAIVKAGQIVFHSAGDTGATTARPGLQDEYNVMDKMVADFDEKDAKAVPQFFYHLGDVVYSFGEHIYYYDQFYVVVRRIGASPARAWPRACDRLRPRLAALAMRR